MKDFSIPSAFPVHGWLFTLLLRVCHAFKPNVNCMQVVGRITAGVDPDSIQVSPGKCAYITTGAKLPRGADAVVKVRKGCPNNKSSKSS